MAQGCIVQISPSGAKSWIFRYMRDGRSHKMGLGPVHTVSLAEARKRAADARLAVHDGRDPIEARAATLAAQRLAAAKTISFKQCAEAYIAANQSAWKNSKHRAQWSATFNATRRDNKVFPAATKIINDLPVSAIDTGLVWRVLEPIWAVKPETASRIRGRIETVLDWASTRGYRSGDNPARWRGHLENVLPPRSKVRRVKHHSALSISRAPALMAELRKLSIVSARALELAILTAARTGEAIAATWAELDLDAGIWTIPASRMKAAREHRVPLSDRALEILRSMPRKGPFVFPGARPGRHLSNMSMLELLRGLRPGEGLTVHGFRSTFRDWCAELTSYPHHVCEMALAHSIGDSVERAYRRGDLFDKRRQLMQDWADFCTS